MMMKFQRPRSTSDVSGREVCKPATKQVYFIISDSLDRIVAAAELLLNRFILDQDPKKRSKSLVINMIRIDTF